MDSVNIGLYANFESILASSFHCNFKLKCIFNRSINNNPLFQLDLKLELTISFLTKYLMYNVAEVGRSLSI